MHTQLPPQVKDKKKLKDLPRSQYSCVLCVCAQTHMFLKQYHSINNKKSETEIGVLQKYSLVFFQLY